MRTTLFLDPTSLAPIVRDIHKAIVSHVGNGSPNYGNMTVEHSADGIACHFDHLLLRLPVLLSSTDIKVTRVTISSDYLSRDYGVLSGDYRRKNSWASVEDKVVRPGHSNPYYCQTIKVWGNSLRLALNLWHDMIDHKVMPVRPGPERKEL